MNKHESKKISKFLSLVLRHQPQTIGITLDDNGWVEIDELLKGMASAKRHVTRDQLKNVVSSNDKQRFTLSDDGRRIRAKQGHSIDVDLGYQPATPPEHLCHGTPERFVPLIRDSGLKKIKRHHVHMHADQNLATEVGGRRGKPILLIVRSLEMHRAGHEFFVTENDVWLTDHVPAEFIDFPKD